jgi:tRNA 2-thiouridine synthesizing protein B
MLHIINKSPLERNSFDSCLRVARSGTILLIEDAVYAATPGNSAEAKVKEALTRFKVCVLGPDLDARGMGGRIIEGVESVGYDGFVDLVASEPNCQSWV